MKLSDLRFRELNFTEARVSQALRRVPDHFEVHPSRRMDFPHSRTWTVWEETDGTYRIYPQFGALFEQICGLDLLALTCILLEFEEATDEHESSARP